MILLVLLFPFLELYSCAEISDACNLDFQIITSINTSSQGESVDRPLCSSLNHFLTDTHPGQHLLKWHQPQRSQRISPDSAKRSNFLENGKLKSELGTGNRRQKSDNLQCWGEGYLSHRLHSSPSRRLPSSHCWPFCQEAIQEGSNAYRRALGGQVRSWM